MDNLKQLNNQISAAATGDGKSATTKSSGAPVSIGNAKMNNKLGENFPAAITSTNVTTRSQYKSAFSNSPPAKRERKGSAKLKSLKETKKIDSVPKVTGPQSNNGLADLNYFIKTIEKDLSEKLKNR
jgi:hypothetical protein